MNLSDSPLNQEAAQPDTPARAMRTIFCSSPVQLRAAAHLYGIDTVALRHARVLELGCGTGDNLLPFAVAYPEAEVVGIDASEADVATAQATAQAMGAVNARFHVMNVLELDPGLGQFDYIILHQAYGKVPAELGQMLLAVCQQRLSPMGIAFVSYTTQPGWKAAEVLRDAMLFAGHASTDMAENIAAARSTLALLKDSIAGGNPMGASLAPVLAYARDLSDEELAAEFLSGEFAPGYFIEFANAAAQSGLIHVGDAEPEQEIPLAYGTNVALFNSLTGLGQTAAVRQQHLDFAVGRAFRRSMLVHADRAGECLPSPDLSRLADLRFAGCFRTSPGAAGGSADHPTFSNQSGRVVVTSDRHALAVMATLTSAWPATCDIDDLARGMLAHAYEEEATVRDRVKQALETLFRAGVIRITRELSTYDLDTGAVLDLGPHLRHVMSSRPNGGTLQLWTLWHEPVTMELGPVNARQIAQFDGKTPADQWLGDQTRDMTRLFEGLRDRGLLSGSSKAWIDTFQALMGHGDVHEPRWRAQFDAFYSHHLRNAANVRAEPVPTPAAVTKALDEVEALRKSDRFTDAEAAARAMVAAHPDAWAGWVGLGKLLRMEQRNDEASAALAMAAVLNPLGALVHTEIAELHVVERNLDLAEAAAARVAQSNPDRPEAYNLIGLILREKRELKASLVSLKFAEKRFPNVTNVHNSLGAVYGESGDHAAAEASYRRALELNPNDNMVHSNLLFQLTHRCEGGTAQLIHEHRLFGERVAKRARSLGRTGLRNTRDAERPLRIGFVSGDLRDHAVMSFLGPIWQQFDRDQFKIYAYHSHPTEDAISDLHRPLTESWHRASRLTDAQLRDRIVEDRIDILFDLSGHTNANRLSMFAMRAAPVQISWIGYPATSGVAEMDYYITDRSVAAPGVLDAQFTEKLVYLPAAFTFSPAVGCPPVRPAPVLRNGHITFGSFNRYNKISDDVLALWSKVLLRVPGSRMLVGNMPRPAMKELTARFVANGIDAKRLTMRENVPLRQYLALHEEVDIALDTFPYTGGTTSCHSVWMGVPILTLSGPTRIQRQTTGVLNLVGLEDWVAESQEDFIERAVMHASDPKRLAALRAGMRERLQNSLFVRSDLVTQGLQKAMRQMWRIWCQDDAPQSFSVEL